jgi:dTDP-4-dehydrorhamnose 3,5-epimerase
VLYKCDALYNKESESGICYNDAELAIDWKVPNDKVIVSEKDLVLSSFKDHDSNF